MNLYSIVRNNPLCLVDMRGLKVYVLISSGYTESLVEDTGSWVPIKVSAELEGRPMTEAQARKAAAQEHERRILRSVENRARHVQQEKDITEQQKNELTPIGIIVRSIGEVKAYAEVGEPTKDHFILWAHSTDRGETGASQRIGIGSQYYAWHSPEIEAMFKVFQDHCLDLTLYVCYVGEETSERISEDIGGGTVYADNRLVEYPPQPDYGSVLEGGRSRFDPTSAQPRLLRHQSAP